MEKLHGFIETPIGKSKRDFRKQEVENVLRAKPSLTEYRVLEYLTPSNSLFNKKREKEGVDRYTLVLVKLHTGRTHQIRVHFKSIGHPLAGDSLYGGKASNIEGLSRQFLHAKKIEVRLPDGTWIETEADLPDDLRGTLEGFKSKAVRQL